MYKPITDFADEVIKNNPDVEACYIAIMPNDEGYDLEVEIDQGTIGGVFATETGDLEAARGLAQSLHDELTLRKIRVFVGREGWETYLSELD